MSVKNIAVITGANGGLGKEFVREIIKDFSVDEIWAVARNIEKLEALKTEFDKDIKIFPLDLSERANLHVIAEALQTGEYNIRYLVNNAGYAKFCSYGDISVDETLNMIDLNIGAVVALGLICIPYMNKGSRIINVASEASFFPLPYQNVYSSTKSFVRNYTRALNVELRDKGITATAVCPGWIKTGLYERGLIGAKKATNNFKGAVEPNPVAKKAVKDALKGKDMSVYGANVKFMHLLSKILPHKFIMKGWLKQQHLK